MMTSNMTEESWTFKAKFSEDGEYLTVNGRWETQKEAAIAAGNWLAIAAEFGYSPIITIFIVIELRSIDQLKDIILPI